MNVRRLLDVLVIQQELDDLVDCVLMTQLELSAVLGALAVLVLIPRTADPPGLVLEERVVEVYNEETYMVPEFLDIRWSLREETFNLFHLLKQSLTGPNNTRIFIQVESPQLR